MSGGAHEQPVEGLDHGEEREVGGAFGGDSAKGRAGPGNREGDEDQGGVEREQDDGGERRSAGDARPEKAGDCENANQFKS